MTRPAPWRTLLCLTPMALLACGSGGGGSDDPPPPAAPSGLTAPSIFSGRIDLAWTDNSGDETGFSVERSPDGSLGWTEIGTTAADTAVYTDIGLNPDTDYHYRVRAVGPGGFSAYTTPLLVTTANMAWEDGPDPHASLTARQGHSAIYDSLNQRMVVFGGEDGSFLQEVWALPLAEDLSSAGWVKLEPTASDPAVGTPDGRYNHSAVYDPVRDRMVVFGGRTNTGPTLTDTGPTNEIWVLSLPNGGTPSWSKLVLPFGPSPRVLHSAVYDAVYDRMIVFGGSSGAAAAFSSEVWALRFSGVGAPNWASLGSANVEGTPIELAEHACVYDPVGQRMLVYGGFNDGGLNGTVYEATLPPVTVPAWSVLSATAPPAARSAAAAVHDAANRRLVVFGGYDDVFNPAFNDVWALSLAGPPTWTAVFPDGTAPPGRAYASAVYDTAHERMVVFGGSDPLFPVDAEVWPLKLK